MKIEVTGSGICRLTGADIEKTGVDPAAIDPATLRMFRLNTEIAIVVSAAGPGISESDFVEFYARGMDNQYTGTDVYWLYWGGDAGERIAWRDGAVSGGTPRVTSFYERLTVEENHEIWTETPNAPAADYWFWKKFTSPQSITYGVDVPSPVKNAANGVLTVYFQGRSGDGAEAAHHTVVSLNNTEISDQVWNGNESFVQFGGMGQTLLLAGRNQVTIGCRSSGTPDVLYLNRIEIAYQRNLSAVGNALWFSLDEEDAGAVEITGFTGAGIHIWDISDPAAPRRISNIDIASSGPGFKAAFAHPGGDKSYVAFTSDAVLTPDRVSYRKLSDLRKLANASDYLVITDKEFMAALEDLCELRRRQGMRVKMVDIEEIYDVFAYGFFDPEAIRAFLQYAYQNWDPPVLRYVLLAGDANLDYRNYFNAKKQNRVPVYLDRTVDLGLTPSDNRYGCVAGDDRVPELYVGRIPGDSPATIGAIVNKLIRYESNRHQDSNGALFVADDDDPAFEALNEVLISYLPGDFLPETVYTRFYNDFDDATADIKSFINEGMAMVNFVGHGDVTRWGAEPAGGGDFIFVPDDIEDLTNENSFPFVLALNCLNGYFSQPLLYSLAEEWVMAKDAGAVACFAPSGLSHQWEHEFISTRIFSRIFLGGENRIGDVAIESKIDAYYSGASDLVLVSFNLIGDPATRLSINRNPADLVTVHAVVASAGAGGAISPDGEILVLDGADRVFTITPDSGYKISSVTVDGVSQGPVGVYTFADVAADHAISAVFETEKSSGGGGGGGGGCFIRTLME